MPRSRRTRCRKWRTRTSSTSSVEIQVTPSSSVATSVTPTAVRAKDTVTASNPLPLVRPIPGFLRLIQTVGAEGTASLHGELFTLKQLCIYLTDYVKHRQLWDPLNPVVVHCGTDPLGQVFQVDRFTLHDAIGLIKRSVLPVVDVDNQGWTKPSNVPHGCCITNQGRDVPHTVTSSCGPQPAAPSCPPLDTTDATCFPSTSFARSDVQKGKAGKPKKMRKKRKRKRNADKAFSSASSEGGSAKVCRVLSDSATVKVCHTSSDSAPVKVCHTSSDSAPVKVCHTSSDSVPVKVCHTSSDSAPVKVCRRRQPSLSITYSSDVGEGSYPWQFKVEMFDSDESEVLSIQSKVTAVVKSSEDDLWFLDESDFSIEVSDNFLAAKVTDPPFAVEYEVDTDTASQSGDTGSLSSEGIYVMCDESDIACWADSESDDNDRSDDDVVEADKWRCCECDTMNHPLHRYCDRCWTLRPGWLPDQLLSLRHKKESSLNCRCTSWSQDHKSHIASARTQAWAERVNSSLSLQASRSVTFHSSDTGSVAADTCQDTSPATQPSVDGTSHDMLSTSVDICGLQKVSQCDMSPDVRHLSTPASRDHSDTNTSNTSSIPSSPYLGVKLSHCDTLPLVDSLVCQRLTHSDSLWMSSVVSANSEDTMTSVTRDDSGIGLGLCRHLIPDCDDLAMADIYKHDSHKISIPTTPGMVTAQTSETTNSLAASFDILNHPSTPAKNTVTSTSSVLQASDVCVICLTRPKEASIIHGNTGHQVCCYICAKRLRHRRMPCPVCRQPISGVIKNYIL